MSSDPRSELSDPPASAPSSGASAPLAAEGPSREHRLHWLSLFIGLGREVRRIGVLVLITVFATRNDSGGERLWYPLIIVGLTTLRAIARYFSFRYRYDASELVIRSGIFFRNERHVPYDRIQNIDATANLVERMVGAVSVELHTGAGKAPDAEFGVLPLAALEDMRARVLGTREMHAAHVAQAASLPPIFAQPLGRTLLHLSARDLLACGFLENRVLGIVLSGLILVERLGRVNSAIGGTVGRLAGRLDWTGLVLTLIAVIGLLLVIRLVSAAWELFRLHDFRLSRHGDDLRTEYGLFTRVTATIPVRRIQAITIHESVLHRWLGRATIRVATAGGGIGHTGRHERELLAPIIRTEAVAALLLELQPSAQLADVPWRAVHPRAFARMLRRWALVTAALCVAAAPFIQWWAAPIALVLLIGGIVRGRLTVRNLAWGPLRDGVVFRTGWFEHTTMLTRFARVQAVELDESPIDRWTGMAEVSVDTAGGLRAARMRMPFMARADAFELRDLVAANAAGTVFVW